ncbi:hypothetical protein PSEUBRA_002807 [Kalmanozyma brasiliensis GHG001]|uniref:Uncharacterized protein n=1 Tax=Kalmanozyma brasiliensis (strain GHG001) TaxID=1365824 RepID=V5EWH9_KALBG|nr:uncharacterized protein PSEUBRA_002807 [Kalmanozyma brasiliensis GHG001]EST07708.1 hypothetical protein PSEUBRA_002807 [Kalmanozyma brasiliensis GHG001]
MMERHYPPQASFNKSRAPFGSKGPPKSSTSTILESTKRPREAQPALSTIPSYGPLLGNTYKSSTPFYPATYDPDFPSPSAESPPVEPSLFAHSSSSRKPKDSNASIQTTSTKKISRTKSSERLTVRNARGEIEWKDMPPIPSTSAHHMLSAAAGSRRPVSPYDQDHRSYNRGYDQQSPTEEAGYMIFGNGAAPRRPRNRRRSTDDNDGFHTADEDDELEAREWERNRDRQMEADRLEVHHRQQAREEERRLQTDEERRARRRVERAERERLAALAFEQEQEEERKRQIEREARRQMEREARRAERERLLAEAEERDRLEREAEEKRRAERIARRLAREQAEREEMERQKQLREEARKRRIEAEEAAAAERAQKEKEKQERKAKRKEEKRLAAIEEAKRAEEARIEAERLAEEARIEAERIAAEEAIEAERLAKEAAIEAERLAKEAVIRAEREAVLEKERKLIEAYQALVEAKRQVEEEDREARRAGRREDRRAQRALAAGFAPGETDPDAQQSDEDEDDDVYQDDAASDDASEVFVDAGADDELDAEAKSATNDSNTGSMARSISNIDGLSSTDGSSDAPATPADEQALSLAAPNGSTADLARQSSSNGGHGHVKFAMGTNGDATPTAAHPAEKIAPYKSDRFRQAVKVGARGRLPVTPAATYTIIPPSTSLLTATFAATDGEDEDEVDHSGEHQIVQPNGPYREGGITYGRGWCAHGLADPSLTIDHRRYVRVPRDTTADKGATDFDEVMYSDLGELVWSATTPDVIARLISHLDYADVKALRQTSQSIRFALGQLAGREIVLSRFLSRIGYEAWSPTEIKGELVEKDPLPLSFSDCEAFLLSFDLRSEYALVGAEYARAPHKMDPRYPRLARSTTRGYDRVLTRLRMQVNYRPPARETDPTVVAISSPWKPGRAGFFRVWVPSTETGAWLSDTELARCERELFIAGVWPHLKKGDVVWDCAVGEERNEGKYIFDGRYLRDLSFMFDRAGHLPAWLNAFAFAPSYYHNIVRSTDASQPVVYLDVLPWRDQIVGSMRLVQDQVETFSPQGARYRISKWLYRAVINVTPIEGVDLGWCGKIVIETEGTAEHAKELISRCAGPAESARVKARLLASVMDADGRPSIPKAPAPTTDEKGNKIETTSPWAIVRARSRPGLIWIRPMDMRERVVF